jgi:hypothetical protein
VGWSIDKILVSILKVQGSTFTNDIMVVNCDLLTKYSFYSCSSLMSFFLLLFNTAPLQHCSRSSSTSFQLLVLNAISLPTFQRWFMFFFGTTHASTLFQLLVLNAIPLPTFQSWFMFFFDTTLAHIPRCPLAPFYCSSYSSLILFLLLFNVAFAFVPKRRSYSLTLFLSSSMLLMLFFYATLVPPILDWYFPPPPSCFCRYRKNKLSKFNLHFSC